MALTSIAGDAGTTSKSRNLGPVTWVTVAVAIVAALAFSVAVVDGGEGSGPVIVEEAPSGPLLRPGSSDAIEHRALAQLRIERASASVSERGGLNAVEHRALAGLPPAEVDDEPVLGEDGCLRWPHGSTAC